jgi:hypothetical protein
MCAASASASPGYFSRGCRSCSRRDRPHAHVVLQFRIRSYRRHSGARRRRERNP